MPGKNCLVKTFDLDCLSDKECKAEFRFWKNNIYLLKEVMQIPDEKKKQQNWLFLASLQNYDDVIHNAGTPYTNCWGFVVRPVRPVCKPVTLERRLYNGLKRLHAVKFQSVVAPNGLIADLFGIV